MSENLVNRDEPDAWKCIWVFGSLAPSFLDDCLRICMCNDKRNCSRLPVSCLMEQKVLLRRVFCGSVLLFLLSFILFSALKKKKKLLWYQLNLSIIPAIVWNSLGTGAATGGHSLKSLLPPLCAAASDKKKLLIQVLLSGTARVTTIVAALKDVQVYRWLS